MAVFIYQEGDHPRGFIGARVATTLGNGEYSQMYFSATSVSLSLAKERADAKNNELRSQAELNKKTARLEKTDNTGTIAGNLRAIIKCDVERLATGTTKYVYPAFVVGSGKSKRIPIGNKYTLDEAFALAVDEYCKRYEYDDEAKQELLSRKPSKELFTNCLYNGAIKNGIPVNFNDLCKRLNKGD